MDIGGSIMSAIAGMGDQLRDFGINNYMFNRQKHWQQTQLTHAHQWEVEDLKNAGLNPILSANTGASGASAPAWAGSNSTSAYDAVAHALDLKQRDKEINNQTKLANSQVALNAAQAARILELTPEEIKTHQWNRQSRIGKELGIEKEYQDAKKLLVETVQNSAETAGEIQGVLEKYDEEQKQKQYQEDKEQNEKYEYWANDNLRSRRKLPKPKPGIYVQ